MQRASSDNENGRVGRLPDARFGRGEPDKSNRGTTVLRTDLDLVILQTGLRAQIPNSKYDP
jgi:hypothetical protein